jgi:hypothetical protein
MTKNKKSILIGGLLIALLVTVLAGIGVSSVYAQSPTTVLAHGGPGGGRGGGFSLTWLKVAADKLGMTTDELITALQSGKTLEQVAQEKGVDYADIQSAIQQQSQTEFRTRIQQAVTDGTITQEKADWLLEGLDKGFIGNGPDGDGFLGGMHGFGLGPDKTPQTQPTAPAQPAPTQQSSQ